MRYVSMPEERTAFGWRYLSAYYVETLSDNVERQVASGTERQRCQAGALVPAGLASYANRRRSDLRRKSMSAFISRSTAWIPSRVEREARAYVREIFRLFGQMYARRVALRRIRVAP